MGRHRPEGRIKRRDRHALVGERRSGPKPFCRRKTALADQDEGIG